MPEVFEAADMAEVEAINEEMIAEDAEPAIAIEEIAEEAYACEIAA